MEDELECELLTTVDTLTDRCQLVMTDTKAELQGQLAEAQQKLTEAEESITDLQAELNAAKESAADAEAALSHKEAEVAGLRNKMESREAEWTEAMEAQRRDAELHLAREKEELRLRLDEDRRRELRVRDDLQKALERLLTEREAELEGLKVEVEAGRGDLSVEPDVVVREEGSLVSRLTEPADSVVSGTMGHSSGVSGSDSVSEGSKEHDRTDTGGAVRGHAGSRDTVRKGVRFAEDTVDSVATKSPGAVATVGGTGVATRSEVAMIGVRENTGRDAESGAAAIGVGAVTTGGGHAETRVEGSGEAAETLVEVSGEEGAGSGSVVLGHGRVPESGMKLPPLPGFNAERQAGHEGEEYERWLRKLNKHAELRRWSQRDKLLQFELLLTDKAERIYEVLPEESKKDYATATKALGERLKPAGRKALSSAQLLRRKQGTGETVDVYVQAFESLFEQSYGTQKGIDPAFRATLKRDLFVQGLSLKWQEKVLPTAETFSDALHQARSAEEQERQLAEMHKREPLRAVPAAGSQPAPGGKKDSRADAQGKKGPARDRSQLRCFKCHGTGHFSRACPMSKSPTETRGSSSAVRSDSSSGEQGDADAEFSRLQQAYSGVNVASVHGGALGPLYYATISVSGSPVEALVDPGSSASIMSTELLKQIGPKAGISKDDLRPPDIVLRNYSRNQITISGRVDLEFTWRGKNVKSPVYVRSDKQEGEPLLLGTNVIVPLGLMEPSRGGGDMGTVRLVKTEKIPGRSGVMVQAVVSGGGCEGQRALVVEPEKELCGLLMEEAVVGPGVDGRVSLMVTNPTCQSQSLKSGQTINRACCLEEPEDPEEVHESGQEAQVYRVCVGPRTEEMSSTRRAELVDSLQMQKV